jgi:DeoR/GlpR family transcriptional regulator of sugar metabolism
MTERDKQIIDLYLNHPELTTAQIAKKFNVSTGTIARIARVNNLPRRNGHIKNEVPQEIKTEIIQKYLKGTSMLQIQK